MTVYLVQILGMTIGDGARRVLEHVTQSEMAPGFL